MDFNVSLDKVHIDNDIRCIAKDHNINTTDELLNNVSIFKDYNADIQIRVMFIVRALVVTRCLSDRI
jgi:hypothetical protein